MTRLLGTNIHIFPVDKPSDVFMMYFKAKFESEAGEIFDTFKNFGMN